MAQQLPLASGSGPRTRAYWVAKRMQGYDQLIRHSTRLEQLALAEEPDEAARRAMRSLRRRIKMLQTTKIPYYEERIEALTFSRWDFIGGQEPF